MKLLPTGVILVELLQVMLAEADDTQSTTICQYWQPTLLDNKD